MNQLAKFILAKLRFGSCNLEPISLFSFDSFLEGQNYIGSGCKILSSRIGRYSYVGKNSEIMLTHVSRYVSIAPSVVIGLQGHDLSMPSTYPPFWYSNQTCSQGLNNKNTQIFHYLQTTIGPDCWIGHSALIKAGVNLSVGSVVGAGSVVTKDLNPYGVYAGSPAKLLRYRFKESIIETLIASQWWTSDFLTAKDFLLNFNETTKSD